MAFSPDSRALYVGSSEDVVRNRTATWERDWHTPIAGSGGSVTLLAASADGHILAAPAPPARVIVQP